jgi:4-diphosphocytidyl-2C-methyl-D-erythritol kinase
MSGSGACVFLPVDDLASGDGASRARRVADRLSDQAESLQVHVCRSMRFHPMRE